jgi:hypothetical protein
MGRGSRRIARSVDELFASGGPAFRWLAESHAASTAGDTLVTLALAGTLFFDVPSSEARGNVALYLLLTLAPFAVLGPVLVGLFRRFPTAYRRGLATTTALRAVVALSMLVVGVAGFWLFPLAFVLLVLSRIFGISRSSILPVVLDEPVELVSANARLARIGILAAAVAVPIGALAVWVAPWPALILAAVVYLVGTWSALQVPVVDLEPAPSEPISRADRLRRVVALPRGLRLARLATAGVRFLNGFLLLLVAFAFRDEDAGVLDFGFLLAAAGVGFFLASLVSPWLERRLREEPMMIAALAIEAAAAFIAAQVFALPAAAALAAAAGLAWGTAKFGFDGLLQATVEPESRGYAFTVSETIFQVAWVVGALIPVAISVPIKVGLALAGVVALLVQLLYISGLLVPLAEARRGRRVAPPVADPPRRDLSDYL